MTVTTDLTLTSVRRLLESEVDCGLETGVQLAVSYRGAHVDLAVGTNGTGAPMTGSTCVPWTCSSKPLGALAFATAWEAGAVGPDTLVGEVLTEFTGDGREDVRVRDLLTHTTGMSDPIMALDAGGDTVEGLAWADLDALIWAVIHSSAPTVLPGAAMIYNPVTNWFVLDRLLNTLSGSEPGASYRDLLARLGMRATLGPDPDLPADQQVTVGTSEAGGAGLDRMRLASDLPLPGIGVWGTMGDLRTVGEVFLAGGQHGHDRVVGSTYVEALTATHWPGTHQRFVSDTDFPYGLGVMTLPSMFGRRCSARTFGHAGGNTSTLLVDPLFGLVVAVYWNGRLDDVKTFARRYALGRALYTDLGLPRLPIGSPADTAAADAQ